MLQRHEHFISNIIKQGAKAQAQLVHLFCWYRLLSFIPFDFIASRILIWLPAKFGNANKFASEITEVSYL